MDKERDSISVGGPMILSASWRNTGDGNEPVFSWYGSCLILVLLSNYTHYKRFDETTYPSKTPTAKPLKFGDG